jgi:transcription elongation factor Elf1
MSCYFSTYRCNDCNHQVLIGWIDIELNRTITFCTSCSDSFEIYPEEGETLLDSNKPHRLFVDGKKWVEVSSKKGRIKKRILQKARIDSGLRIPIHEDIAQRGDERYFVYTFIFDDIDCPSCQTKGSLVEYKDYVKTCPQCKVGTMSEYDL